MMMSCAWSKHGEDILLGLLGITNRGTWVCHVMLHADTTDYLWLRVCK